ncbi:hypothetical protein BD289DRAFT_432109 [Coniella lustricola]|uniref:Uncharacterized protein n=1 Tax=Coniella lustricola TaxID=2025994 RepID=A0A2T3AA76_9PEZI|nr:hypothetical protein BD289DRAFT_432109 [Coniella lustricola]
MSSFLQRRDRLKAPEVTKNEVMEKASFQFQLVWPSWPRRSSGLATCWASTFDNHHAVMARSTNAKEHETMEIALPDAPVKSSVKAAARLSQGSFQPATTTSSLDPYPRKGPAHIGVQCLGLQLFDVSHFGNYSPFGCTMLNDCIRCRTSCATATYRT